MFAVIVTGVLFGKIRFGKFSVGASGTLFTGLFFGWIAYGIGKNISDKDVSYGTVSKVMADGIVSSQFFDLFLIIFVASVGLLASKDILAVLKKYGARFIVIGVTTTFVGFLMTYGLTLAFTANSTVSPFAVSGVYTGALTSSPGLAAALETAKTESAKISEDYGDAGLEKKQEILDSISPDEKLDPAAYPVLSAEQVELYSNHAAAEVGIGHAVAYPFGVLIVILGMNFFPKIFRLNLKEEWERYETELQGVFGDAAGRPPEGEFSAVGFFLVAVIGYFFGGITMPLGPLGTFSLGSTGSVLIVALIFGCIGQIGPLNFRMEEKPLIFLRQFSLCFFLGIIGLRYGGQVAESVSRSGFVLILAAALICVVAATFSFVLGRFVFKLNWILLSGAICGGMTSTPGLGAAVDALESGKPAAGYGAAYPFALLTKVILVIVLHKLPM
jgi:putative transport protein